MIGEANIFISKDGALERLVESRYDSEAKLQSLLADHPELLGGEQIDDEFPRRWLLVGREVGIADAEGASDRWSIDHIFIDQDATPTFVEVKRSSDARIRREVVGQLIEYVANAARFWPPNHLQMVAMETASKNKKDVNGLLAGLLEGEGGESSTFWSRANENLKEGKVRLMFVADEIPPELRRMAEFLNDQMTHTEVLAVEVRQYVGTSGVAALVPFVRNATSKARDVKEAARKRNRWTEKDFVEHLEADRRSCGTSGCQSGFRRTEEERHLGELRDRPDSDLQSSPTRNWAGVADHFEIRRRSRRQLRLHRRYLR